MATPTFDYDQLGESLAQALAAERAQGVNTREESYSPIFKISSGIEKALQPFLKDVPGFRIGVLKLTAAVTQFAFDALELQRGSLKFNRTFSQAIAAAGDKIEGLPGGIQTSLTSLFQFQSAGLNNTSKQTLRLANIMEITGQNVGSLVKMNKNLITVGLLNSSQVSLLSENTESLASSYRVSSENLISAMESLGQSMTVMGLTGAAPETLKSIEGLAAKFPQFGDKIGGLVDELVRADLGLLAQLGVYTDVEKLVTRGMNQTELVELFKKTSQGQEQVGSFGSGTSLAGIKMMQAFGGNIGTLATQLTQGMDQTKALTATEKLSQVMVDFKTAFVTHLSPLAVIIGKVATGLLVVGGRITEWVSNSVVAQTLLKFWMGRVVTTLLISVAKTVLNTIATIANTAAQMAGSFTRAGAAAAPLLGIGGAAGVGMMGAGAGMLGIAAAIAIPVLLGIGVLWIINKLANTTETLAEAEADRARLAVRETRIRTNGQSRFEAVITTLFSSYLQSQAAASSALAHASLEGTAAIVAAVDNVSETLDEGRGGADAIIRRGLSLA